MAHRVQLKRTKGWRMPENTVKVDRTTRFGNPWKVGDRANIDIVEDAADAVLAFRAWVDAPCHADVLLELANPDRSER